MPLFPSQHHAPARHLFALTLLVACAGFAASTRAQSSDASESADPGGSSWGLGLGVASRQQPYTGVDRDTKAVPLVSYQSRWFRVTGATAELRLGDFSLTPSQELSPGLRLKYEDAGYEASDSPSLAGMEDRKSSFWGGLGVDWKTPIAKFGAEWVADLSGHSKGQKLRLQVDRRFQSGSFGVTPRLQAEWWDAKYVDYYFGVHAQEALTDRPAYAGTSATAVEAGLRLDYMVNRHHMLFADLGVTALPEEVKNSPLVDRSTVSRVTLGYLYRF